jgi:hypothetical protein
MSLVFLNSARQALLLDPLDAGGITTAMPCLDFCLRLRCDGRGARRPSSFRRLFLYDPVSGDRNDIFSLEHFHGG